MLPPIDRYGRWANFFKSICFVCLREACFTPQHCQNNGRLEADPEVRLCILCVDLYVSQKQSAPWICPRVRHLRRVNLTYFTNEPALLKLEVREHGI